jgi:hypothetical protein
MIENLKDSLTKEYRGIIWVTEDSLEKKPKPFFDLDYFLNGLLSKFLNGGKNLKRINLLFSKSFGHSFFLIQSQKDVPDLKKDISEVMNLIEHHKGPFNRILILGKNLESFQSYLDSHFKKFTFDYFD